MNYFLWGLLGPATWPGWFAVLALLLMATRRAHAARWALGGSVALFALFGLTPLGLALVRPLEARFPAARIETAPTDIVVLAGGEALRQSAESGHPEYTDAADRAIQGATLARRFPDARLWIAGGVSARGLPATDADWTARLWRNLGIADRRIVELEGTFDTCGNASGVAARPHGERILLVTSAYHMPRSVGCFRAAGIEPLPFPVDYQGWRARDLRDAWTPNVHSSVGRVDTALHEYVGLAYYRLQGRIDDIWPAPDQALGSRSQTRSE